MAILTMAEDMDPDAKRLWVKYCLCKEFGWTPEQYDRMSWVEKEKMARIHFAIKRKINSLRRLSNG